MILNNALCAFLSVCLYVLNAKVATAQISTPTDVANLIFWADGKDVNGTGMQPADGSIITTWVDKSASGNNLTTVAGTVTFEALGFDGLHPGLRFPEMAQMTASNPFGSDTHDETTVFFINNNVTATRNFALSLNGTNTGGGSSTGRFSFHAPWINNNVFFDAGGTGSARLHGSNPNAQTETTLYTGLNDLMGKQQLFRIDGQAFLSDMTGRDTDVSGGINLGTISATRPFDGRFAEILVYNRALTLAEIQDVECFLLLKWKLRHAPAGCAVETSATKTVETYVSTGTDSYAIPGTDVIYTISVTHNSGPSLDAERVFLTDAIPPEVIFYNGDIDDGGPKTTPVIFSSSGSGLTFDYAADVAYSNLAVQPNEMSDCNYMPGAGYDPNVTFVCIKPSGIFNSGTPDPFFEVSFRTRIK